MQRAVDRANADASVDLSIKIGISVGDVTEDDGDWFGMPVNEAARLCAAADGGQILASDVVRLLAGSALGTRCDRRERASSRACPNRWQCASSSGRARKRASTSHSRRGSSPVVRSSAGMPSSRSCSTSGVSARHGTAATVLVGGEPGIGKTRLAATVAAAAHADGAARCSAAARRRPRRARTARGSRPCGTSCSASTRRRFGLGRRPDPRARAGRARALRAHRRSGAALDRGSGVGAVRVVRGRHRAPHRRGRGEAVAAVLDDLQWCDTASLLLCAT